MAPWGLSLLVFAVLAVARFCAAWGPPQLQILFLLHVLAMWALPWIFLNAEGRRGIGLCRPRKWLPALALSGIAGGFAGLLCFAVGWTTPHDSPSNLLVCVHHGLQLEQMRAAMPLGLILVAIGVPAVILMPVGEEIFFRGIMQQAFAQRFGGIAATLVQGVAFGVVHLQIVAVSLDAAGFHFRWLAGAATLAGGILVGALLTICRMRSGSLFASMAAHAACNLTMIGAVIFYFSS
ncbi:MAG: type II CAAX endopeptidase family protein [Terracidiphilus sp.]